MNELRALEDYMYRLRGTRKGNCYRRLSQKARAEAFERLFQKRTGCGVCGKREGVKLVVDHDHHTGEVRDLLCRNCNVAIGNLQEDPELCRKAAAYLELYRRQR